MKIAELKINNLVYFPRGEGNDLCEVWSINLEETVEISCNGDNEGESNYSKTVDCENIVPIPLTEEWLIKFGFKKDQNNRFVINNYTGLCFELKSQGYCYRYTNVGIIEITHGFKYVHQLQNLYFALTNEELILNQ